MASDFIPWFFVGECLLFLGVLLFAVIEEAILSQRQNKADSPEPAKPKPNRATASQAAERNDYDLAA